MKIISKFKDYYDIGLSYGVDEKLRLERIRSEFPFSFCSYNPISFIHAKDGLNCRYSFYFEYIGFCGKVYPLVHLYLYERSKKNKQFFYKLLEEQFFYTKDDLDTFMKQNIKDISELKKTGIYNYGDSLNKCFTSFYIHKQESIEKVFHDKEIAYFAIKQYYEKNERNHYLIKHNLIIYPELKTYKFVQVKKPMQAFQEISMYIGSVEPEVTRIQDKYLAQSKGYDCYSFRKAATKKPPR